MGIFLGDNKHAGHVRIELFADRLPRPLPTLPPAHRPRSTRHVSRSPSPQPGEPPPHPRAAHCPLPAHASSEPTGGGLSSREIPAPPAATSPVKTSCFVPSVAATGSPLTTRRPRGRQGLRWDSSGKSYPMFLVWRKNTDAAVCGRTLCSPDALTPPPPRACQHAALSWNFLHTCQPGVARVQPPAHPPPVRALCSPAVGLVPAPPPCSSSCFPSGDCTRPTRGSPLHLPLHPQPPAPLPTSAPTQTLAYLGNADSSALAALASLPCGL